MSYATAYDVENAFCAYKKHIAEIWSDHRNEAAACRDEYKYYYESASINCCIFGSLIVIFGAYSCDTIDVKQRS